VSGYRLLLKVLGPAQLSPRDSAKPLDDAATRRAATTLQGMRLVKSSDGRTYLVEDDDRT
jgi:hypothetical protein